MSSSVELKPSTIAIGVAFAATWVVVLIALFRRTSPTVVNNIGLPNVLGLPNGGWQLEGAQPIAPVAPIPVYQAPNPDPNVRGDRGTRLATYTLQTSQGTRVFTAASDRHWIATLRTIGPPGSIAWVADNPNNLNYPSASTQIPVGTPVEIRLNPRQGLFAIGNQAGVTLTVTGNEDLG